MFGPSPQFFQTIKPILPEAVMVLAALLVLLLAPFFRKDRAPWLGWSSLVGIIAAGIALLLLEGNGSFFANTVLIDPFAIFLKFGFCIACGLGILLSLDSLQSQDACRGEYYSLMLLATCGMMLLASAGDLITLYLGLELMSLSLTVLVGFLRQDTRSNEAGVKYLVLCMFSSAIMLYGMSLLYGICGTTSLSGMLTVLKTADPTNPALVLALLMLIAGFGFKVAAVPFHMWAPDVYEGAPVSVTAFLSAGPLLAGFGVLLRIFLYTLAPLHAQISTVLAVLAVLSMAFGAIMALSQTNIKRMLAYLTIAHTGCAFAGLAAGGPEGAASVLFYISMIALMNMGAFGVVIMLKNTSGRGEALADFSGLGKTAKTTALLMLLFMVSMAGLPPLVGFIGKFYIFKATMQAGLLWLALVGGLCSLLCAYCYLRVVMQMYMQEPKTSSAVSASPSLLVAVTLAAIAIVAIGIYPTGFLNFVRGSIVGIL